MHTFIYLQEFTIFSSYKSGVVKVMESTEIAFLHMDMSEENIKKIPESKYKSLVKKQANEASINYLKQKQT